MNEKVTKKPSIINTGKELYKKTSIVNINNASYDVYCGRPGPFGNPFKEDVDGTKNEVIEKYKYWMLLPEQKKLRESMIELDGKVLGCHCFPKKCHVEIIIEIIESLKNKKRLDMLFGG